MFTCTICSFENLPEMRYCGYCGVQLGPACLVCGFVNPTNHRFCGQCGTRLVEESLAVGQAPREAPVAPEPLPLPLEGERRQATVILADVTGSTPILERIGTEAWVQTMNRVLQLLEAEVYRFGGTVDQFRGDGLVAFFGANLAHEDDPERAVLAALAMHRAIEPFSAELAEREGIDLRVRVGVNTGEVIVASIGDDRHHSEDTAMGEAIALAARLESAAQPGTVLVSNNTYHLVESRFEWEPLGSIKLKGISQPVSVYRPLTPRAGATRVRRLQPHDLSALLIGRETEFEALNARVENLRAGQGGIIVLTGDTGMGKSSLIASARQHTVRDDALLAKAGGNESPLAALSPRSLTWLHGRCRSYAQASPYSMWLDLLGSWLNVREDEPALETRDRLRQRADALWNGRSEAHYPYLATLLSLPLEDAFAQRAKNLNAEGRKQQTFETIRSWVKEMARQRPLALVFEDVHWADTTSLELLEYCLPLCEHQPVLWINVFRLDPTPAMWDLTQHVETEFPQHLDSLTLAPLTEGQGAKMIERLIGPQVLSDETRALLLDRAEGNPYYIEEFIYALIREGVLVQDAKEGRWQATREVDSLDLPGSLQNLLMARIDRLEPDERRVLQMASVIGPTFWSKVLDALLCDAARPEAIEMKECLLALQRAQFIHEHRQVPHLGIEYGFDSNLIRDAAYERLLSVQRVSCHRKVADALEQIFGETVLARYYSLLAYHYHQAGVTRKELFYTLLAAEEAREIYANVEALEYYTRALQLLDEIEGHASDKSQLFAIRTQRFEVLNGRREVYYLTGDIAASWGDAEALLPLARQLEDDPVWLIDALLQQPGVGFFRNKEDVSLGVTMAEQALALSRQLGDRRREMQCLGRLAGQRYFLNDPTWQDLMEQALEMARELGDKRTEVGILTAVGDIYAMSDPARSQEYLALALPIVKALDDKTAELDLLNVISEQLESSGDYYRRLVECHEKQLEISREIGHRPAEAKALMFCGQIQSLYLGDDEAGLVLLEEAIRVREGVLVEVYPLLRIAQIHVAQGRYDEAQAVVERARRHDEQLADLGHAGLSLVTAIVYNAMREEAKLRSVLELTAQAFHMSAENPQLSQQYQMAAKCEAAAAHLGLAELLADETERQRHLLEALECSQEALHVYESFGFVRPIECVSEEILYRHSLALAANGQETEANEYLRRAFDEMMRKHDLIPEDSHYRDTFLENIPLHREIRARVASVL